MPVAELAKSLALERPYPGLRSFESSEAPLFYGREAHTEELLRRLVGSRFLAVVGKSGSGKSSLVRAGLLPALYRGFLSGATTRWRIAVMRPGNAPVRNLAIALAEQGIVSQDADAVREVIAKSSLGLVNAVRQTELEPGESVLIVVDQFEELFRFQSERRRDDGGAEGALFVASLLEAAESYPAVIYVVLTMRTDYLGECADFTSLPEALNRGQYLVPKLGREQRREAIERPLDLFAVTIAPRLVQRLLADLGEDQNQLPVLQHAMNRTYYFWKQEGGTGPLDLGHYEAAGGIENALNSHAESLYRGQTTGAQYWTERLFRCLTMWENGRAIRRPGRLERVLEVVGAEDDASRDLVRQAILRFAAPGDCLLSSTTGTALGADSVIDISHESLIWNWSRLRQWVREEGEAVDWYQSVVQDTLRNRIGAAGTWRDPKLARAQDYIERGLWSEPWARQYPPPAGQVSFREAADFLRRGAVEQKSERRTQKQLQVVLTVLALALLIASATSGWYWRQELAARDKLIGSESMILELNSRIRSVDKEKDSNQRRILELQEELNRTSKSQPQMPLPAERVSQLRAELKNLQDQNKIIEQRRQGYEKKVREQTKAQKKIETGANVPQGPYSVTLAKIDELENELRQNSSKSTVTEIASSVHTSSQTTEVRRTTRTEAVVQSSGPNRPSAPQVEATVAPQLNSEGSVVVRAYSAQQMIVPGLSSPIGIFLPEVPRPHSATQLYVITGSAELPPSFSGDKEAAKRLVKILRKGTGCPGPLQNGAWTGQCFEIPKVAGPSQPRRLGTFTVGMRLYQMVVDPGMRGRDSITVVVSELSPSPSKSER